MERERLSFTIYYTDHEKQKKKEREKEETSYQVVREIHIKTASRFHFTPAEQSRSRKVVTAIAVQDVENGSGPHSLLVRL